MTPAKRVTKMYGREMNTFDIRNMAVYNRAQKKKKREKEKTNPRKIKKERKKKKRNQKFDNN